MCTICVNFFFFLVSYEDKETVRHQLLINDLLVVHGPCVSLVTLPVCGERGKIREGVIK